MRNMLHGRKPFRLVSLMLALAMVLAAVPFAAAGAERDDIDFNDMSFAHWGMAMTARMIANAVDHKAEIGPARYMGWCSVPLMRPDKVFVLQLTSGQFSAAREALEQLTDREKTIVTLRYGIGGGREKTQKEVADLMGISQSYISRLEKRIILRLRRDILKQIC